MEYIHSRNLVYRDVKPENFVIGRGKLRKDQTLYVVDFGLAKEYIVNGSHIPLMSGRSITGTVRYISVNTHHGAGMMLFARPSLGVLNSSAVRIDYFCSRLIVDYFSYNTRITFQRYT